MGKQKKYTDKFRQDAVNIYLKGDLSAAQLSKKLGVHEHTMCKWIKLYSKDGFAARQTCEEQTSLSEDVPVKQVPHFKCSDALEYIYNIKKQITELEKLISMHHNFDEFSP